MTVLPTDPAAVFIGSVLRDPGDGPWGGGAYHSASLPPRQCTSCGGTGWLAFTDPFLGDTLDARCPTCCGGA